MSGKAPLMTTLPPTSSASADKAYGEYARYSLARLEEALDLDEAALENLVLEDLVVQNLVLRKEVLVLVLLELMRVM